MKTTIWKILLAVWLVLGVVDPQMAERVAMAPVASVQAATTPIYVRQGVGDNRNSGSTQNATPDFEFTDCDWTASSRTLVKAGADFSGITTDMWGSIYLDGATQTVSIRKVATVNDGTDTITFSTAGSGTVPVDGTATVTVRFGGAMAGPHQLNTFPINFIAAAHINAANEFPEIFMQGTFKMIGLISNTIPNMIISGYTTTPGDGGKASILCDQATASNNVVYPAFGTSSAAVGNIIRNLRFGSNYVGSAVGNSATGNHLFRTEGASTIVDNVEVFGAGRGGIRIAGDGSSCIRFWVHHNNHDDASDFGGWSSDAKVFAGWGISEDNNGFGSDSDNLGFVFQPGTGELITGYRLQARRNTKHGFQIQGSGAQVTLIHCIADQHDDASFYTTGTANSQILIVNSVASRSTYGVQRSTAVDGAIQLINQAYYSMGTANTLNINSSFLGTAINLSALPWDGNYNLNNTAGGGALLRGLQMATADALATSYIDAGAVQHQDAGGGGTTIVNGSSIFSR